MATRPGGARTRAMRHFVGMTRVGWMSVAGEPAKGFGGVGGIETGLYDMLF